LAPRDIVSGANVRRISASCLAGARPQPTASSGLAGPARALRRWLSPDTASGMARTPQTGPAATGTRSVAATVAGSQQRHGQVLPRSALPAPLGTPRQCAIMHDVRSAPGCWPISTIRYN
jgi:hypothetical protein